MCVECCCLRRSENTGYHALACRDEKSVSGMIHQGVVLWLSQKVTHSELESDTAPYSVFGGIPPDLPIPHPNFQGRPLEITRWSSLVT